MLGKGEAGGEGGGSIENVPSINRSHVLSQLYIPIFSQLILFDNKRINDGRWIRQIIRSKAFQDIHVRTRRLKGRGRVVG